MPRTVRATSFASGKATMYLLQDVDGMRKDGRCTVDPAVCRMRWWGYPLIIEAAKGKTKGGATAAYTHAWVEGEAMVGTRGIDAHGRASKLAASVPILGTAGDMYVVVTRTCTGPVQKWWEHQLASYVCVWAGASWRVLFLQCPMCRSDELLYQPHPIKLDWFHTVAQLM